MALRKITILTVFCLLSVAFLSSLLYWLWPKLAWHMRYGETLDSHSKIVESYLRAKRMDELLSVHSPNKWYVSSHTSSRQLGSEYMVMLKYCYPLPKWDSERIVAWVDKNLMVQRYLIVRRQNCPRRKIGDAIGFKVPTTLDNFSHTIESLGFVKCCHAALLDLERRRYGIRSYDTAPIFFYEARLGGEIWLYWETDWAGNILARGAHDSP